MKIFYHTSATATGGRDGRTQVDDGSIGFDLVSMQDKSGKARTLNNCLQWVTPPALTVQ